MNDEKRELLVQRIKLEGRAAAKAQCYCPFCRRW